VDPFTIHECAVGGIEICYLNGTVVGKVDMGMPARDERIIAKERRQLALPPSTMPVEGTGIRRPRWLPEMMTRLGTSDPGRVAAASLDTPASSCRVVRPHQKTDGASHR